MKTDLQNAIAAIVVVVSTLSAGHPAHAQGSFIFDQQSSDESNLGEGVATIQTSQPIGQSFTPALSSVGFVRLYLVDASVNGLGATVSVNLRTDSISGPILGSTDPVSMTDGFIGAVSFLFSVPLQVIPGSTYYFQPVVQSGDSWRIITHNAFNYAGGTAFYFGQPAQSSDLWFREGIIIPEPSSALLVISGLAVLLYAPLARHFRKRMRR